MTTVFGSAIPCRRACKVGSLADDATLVRFARPNQITDNDQPQ